jgi:environmental stress-induced protein Ves
MILLPRNERTPLPWKNGGGTTTDVAVYPPGSAGGDFDWRVSVATIESDSVFSSFPGVDRVLMPLSPGGLALQDAGGRHPIARFEPFGFAGETPIEAVDVAQRSLDLNLMTRRGAVEGSMTRTRVEGVHEFSRAVDGIGLIVVLEGELTTDDGAVLEALDAVQLDAGVTQFRGRALVAVILLSAPAGVAGRIPARVRLLGLGS